MRVALLLLFLFAPAVVTASPLEIQPFFTRNQSPLVQIFGLPPAEGGKVAGQGHTATRLVFDASNIFTGDENEVEELRLDGESYRLTLVLRHGLSDRFEIGIDLPYVWHTGGQLDGFIEGFHRTFNLPQGGRDEWDEDRLGYFSIRDGETRLDIDEPQDGFGDVVLTAGLELFRSEGAEGMMSVALRPAVKLPTGSGRKLTGSGSTDFSLRLAATDSLSLAPWSLTWYGALGGMFMTDGEVLEDRQRDVVGFGTLGLGWSPFSWLALMAQIDGHTPFYHGTDLHQLDDTSLQIVLGLSFPLPAEVRCDLGVTEDLLVETAPDVVFHLALWRRF